MTRHYVGKGLLIGLGAVACALGTMPLGGTAQQLELVAPVASETLQYRTDDFVLFFAPVGVEGRLEGLRLAITNTAGNAISIDWRQSYFVLPSGDRSEVVTADVPASLQRNPTQVAIRQTVEVVAIPLEHVSYSESGWSIGAIDLPPGGEVALHVAILRAGQAAADGHDLTFRLVGEERTGLLSDSRVPVWSALVALGVGFLFGLLLAAP